MDDESANYLRSSAAIINTMDRADIVAALRALPDQVQDLLRGLSDDQLRRRPAPNEWSLLELVCHLRDSAEIEGLRVRRMVEEDEPSIEPYDQEALARERNYQGDDPRRALTALRAFWGGLAYQLESLSDQEWERAGTHPEIGTVTVRSRAERAADHAREHLAQVRAVRERLSA